jgi:hypothetical protein
VSHFKAVTAAAPHNGANGRRHSDQLGGVIGAKANLTQPKTQRPDRAQERYGIPRPDTAGFVSVYDGAQFLGTCVARWLALFLRK